MTRLQSNAIVAAAMLSVVVLSAHTPCSAAAIEGNAGLSVDNEQPKNRGINDWEFAQVMRSLLVDNQGKAKARGAVFLFDTCFGGGMLDDLGAAFAGTTLSWVAGAAGAPRQNSFGQDSLTEHGQKLTIARNSQYPPPYKPAVLAVDADPELMNVFVGLEPLGTWTRALLPALTDPDVAVLQAIGNAAQNDLAGMNASGTVERFVEDILFQQLQTGTSASGNGGDGLKIADPQAASYHAILWSGLDNRTRFRTSKRAMRTMLTEQWTRAGNPAMTFHDLGALNGPGSPPATRQTLEAAIAAVAHGLGPNEVFLFYASGHGQPGNPRPQPKVVPPGPQALNFEASAEVLNDIAVYQPYPVLDISYSGLADEIDVLLNGRPLGKLQPGLYDPLTMSFPLDRDWLTLTNEVLFENATGLPFTVNAVDFFPGQCCDFTVPEPGALSLLLVPMIWLGVTSPRARSRASLIRARQAASRHRPSSASTTATTGSRSRAP